MIIVMACAGRKHNAGRFALRRQFVHFAAHPETYIDFHDGVFAAPDDTAEDGQSWREKLAAYNQTPQDNLLGFLPAGELYRPPVYAELAAHVGADKLYILSAGWGLVRSDFLLPDYNITFSPHADRGVRRFRTDEQWCDFMQLPTDIIEPVICFGSRAYIRFFTRLTSSIAAPRHAFRRVAVGDEGEAKMLGGVRIYDYGTDRRTNWHHACARDFMNGEIGI